MQTSFVYSYSIDPLIGLANTPLFFLFAEENLETYFGSFLVRISTMRLSSIESPA